MVYFKSIFIYVSVRLEVVDTLVVESSEKALTLLGWDHHYSEAVQELSVAVNAPAGVLNIILEHSFVS